MTTSDPTVQAAQTWIVSLFMAANNLLANENRPCLSFPASTLDCITPCDDLAVPSRRELEGISLSFS